MIKYRKTIFGSLVLLLVLIASVLYPLYGPADYDKELLIYNEAGKVIERAPSPPSIDHLLGTNRNGEDNFLLILDGAKYTLGISVLIALIRAFLGMFMGLVMEVWMPSMKRYFGDFFLGFRYIPSLIIAIILMLPIAGSYTGRSIGSTMLLQTIFLVAVAFPTITLMTADYVGELLNKSFVRSSQLMGATKIHIVKKHLTPYLLPYSLLVFVQQLVQTMVILTHLGVFELFLGGQTQEGIFGIDNGRPEPSTITNEWSGLIGQNFTVFIQYPWIVLSTIFGFFILIALANMIKKELEQNFQQHPTGLKKEQATREQVIVDQSGKAAFVLLEARKNSQSQNLS